MRISDWSSDVCSSDLIVVKRCRESSPGPVIGPVIDQALSDSLGVDRHTTPNHYAPDSSFHRRRSGCGQGEMALCYLSPDPGHGNTGVSPLRATGSAVLCAHSPHYRGALTANGWNGPADAGRTCRIRRLWVGRGVG